MKARDASASKKKSGRFAIIMASFSDCHGYEVISKQLPLRLEMFMIFVLLVEESLLEQFKSTQVRADF